MDVKSGNSKLPYHKPGFRIYGDIKTLTLAIAGGSGMQDNPTMANQKTAPAP